MLDFYADWCVSCKEMEKYTFTDAAVQRALRDAILLRADVTANDATDQALLARFGIYGPPTIAFFGRDGKEEKSYRVVGFVPAAKFQTHLEGLFGSGPVHFFHVAVKPRVENKNRKARFHRAVISPDLVTPGLAADSFRAPAILRNSACRRPRILPMACGGRDR
jgi:thiol-disulfide isomerase/thioredoxin